MRVSLLDVGQSVLELFRAPLVRSCCLVRLVKLGLQNEQPLISGLSLLLEVLETCDKV